VLPGLTLGLFLGDMNCGDDAPSFVLFKAEATTEDDPDVVIIGSPSHLRAEAADKMEADE